MTRAEFGGLVPVGYRFPLARPVSAPPSAEPVAGPEPFGLRFFRSADTGGAVPSFRYSHDLQIALTEDGATPLIAASSAPEKTTTGDGGTPRGEEFRIDFAVDHDR